jgi:Ran GTPase-activating protein (RanGAP) involved in mRNA processing and transport
MQALFEGMQDNTICTTFYSSGHPISSTAISSLSSLLKKNSTLKQICVGDATFGDAGLAALGPSLQRRCSLNLLDLENKGISASGVRRLVLQLQENTSIRTLVLSRNDLGVEGIAALSSSPLQLVHLEMKACGLGGNSLATGAFQKPPCGDGREV